MAKECECPVEHTITKLGHCRTCPFHKQAFGELEINRVTTPGAFTMFVCGPTFCVPVTREVAGGTITGGEPHDFDWATYSDATTSYGVCRCGLNAMDHALMTGP